MFCMPYKNINDRRARDKRRIALLPKKPCVVCKTETHNPMYCSRRCSNFVRLNSEEHKNLCREGMKKLRKKFCKHGHDLSITRQYVVDSRGHRCPFCSECKANRKYDYRVQQPERYEYSMRKHNYAKKGGLTPEDFEYLNTVQDGKCAICRNAESDNKRVRLSLDHDHKLKTNRGLLCSRCNHGLGHFKDNPELMRRAAEYIEAWLQGREEQKAA